MSEDTSKVLVVQGEWSGEVAAAACVVGVAASIVSTIFFWRMAFSIDLATTGPVVPDSSWVDGSFAQRATLVAVLLALWLASLVFLATGVLAVIEARAVTQRTVTAETTGAPQGAGSRRNAVQSVSEAVKAVSVIADKLTRARGTVVLGVCGMVIVAGAFTVLGAVLTGDGGGSVADGAGRTATPTVQDEDQQTEGPAVPGDGAAVTEGTSGGDE